MQCDKPTPLSTSCMIRVSAEATLKAMACSGRVGWAGGEQGGKDTTGPKAGTGLKASTTTRASTRGKGWDRIERSSILLLTKLMPLPRVEARVVVDVERAEINRGLSPVAAVVLLVLLRH